MEASIVLRNFIISNFNPVANFDVILTGKDVKKRI